MTSGPAFTCHPSVCLFICPSICLSVNLSIHLALTVAEIFESSLTFSFSYWLSANIANRIRPCENQVNFQKSLSIDRFKYLYAVFSYSNKFMRQDVIEFSKNCSMDYHLKLFAELILLLSKEKWYKFHQT